MDEDNWSIVCKPKRVKSGEIKALIDGKKFISLFRCLC